MAELNTNILIIEDDIILAETIHDLLEISGYDSQIIHDGAQALEHLYHHVYPVILLDMHLPNIAGMEILQFIKDDIRFATTQVIAMTADDALQKEAESHTMSLLKPISGDKLIATIEDILDLG